MWRLQDAAVERLYGRARADRWSVPRETFSAALERSARRAFADEPEARELERYLDSLHLEDLALACACAAGHEAAWEHFVREYRPALYRSADAIDAAGGARELADSLYGELFGLSERGGERRAHFDYFHGRSSMATWLRAVLAQRYVDRVRSVRRFEPLPADEAPGALPASSQPESATRYLALMRQVITTVVARLAPRDRLRLSCYYAQDLTLAQIGQMLGEHEATVSRHLTRARRDIRREVERHLREHEHMGEAEISECFNALVQDAGSLDVTDLLGPPLEQAGATPPQGARKETGGRRSKGRPEGANA